MTNSAGAPQRRCHMPSRGSVSKDNTSLARLCGLGVQRTFHQLSNQRHQQGGGRAWELGGGGRTGQDSRERCVRLGRSAHLLALGRLCSWVMYTANSWPHSQARGCLSQGSAPAPGGFPPATATKKVRRVWPPLEGASGLVQETFITLKIFSFFCLLFFLLTCISSTAYFLAFSVEKCSQVPRLICEGRAVNRGALGNPSARFYQHAQTAC